MSSLWLCAIGNCWSGTFLESHFFFFIVHLISEILKHISCCLDGKHEKGNDMGPFHGEIVMMFKGDVL